MARQRKNIYQDANKNHDKGTNSSSSNGSGYLKVKERKAKIHEMFWKQLIVFAVIGVAIYFGYLGYLETRVNTPFDDKKIIVNGGLDFTDQFWGTYRPGSYFGLKTRDPQSLVTGLMWYFPRRLKPGGDGIRHWCEQGDNLGRYGWNQHDGSNFGIQEIQDGPFNLTTSFVKKLGGSNGGVWTARISTEVMPNYTQPDFVTEEVSLIWYAALDESTQGELSLTNSGTTLTGIRGYTNNLGEFNMKLHVHKGEIEHESFLHTTAPGLDLLKETLFSSLRLAQNPHSSTRKIILGGEIKPAGADKKSPNFVAIQLTAKMPIIIDVVYESRSFENTETLRGDTYTETLNWFRNRFNQKFEDTFQLKHKGFSDKHINFAQAALSNMVGGIGYFYGSSIVQSSYTKEPVNYWKAPLFTAVPSRSFFPRGFLWDEGFHGLLISQWNLDLELDIMSYWFDLLNVEGWIPREQILGVEALAKVPPEFVVQRNSNANPPTFFLTLRSILKKYENQMTSERMNILDKLYPRLQAWFTWFNTTQRGILPGSYRWRGRDAETQRELNPKTLTSGLDDYPRASHPTDHERHIDLYCWIAMASDTLAKLGKLLGRENIKKYEQTASYLMDVSLMDKLHWSNYSQMYADYGYHSDSIKLQRPKPLPRQENQNMELTRKVLKQPEYRLIDSNFGYVSLFPLIMQILPADSPKLEKTLIHLRDPAMLWTNFGLRSLSINSPLYMKRNTEHDPPYWRGQIWININFLVVQALHYYLNIEGPYQEKAKEIYFDLKKNIINNVVNQYYKTGYIWEQYNDKTGEGSGCRPFTGWSALTVLLMSEGFS